MTPKHVSDVAHNILIVKHHITANTHQTWLAIAHWMWITTVAKIQTRIKRGSHLAITHWITIMPCCKKFKHAHVKRGTHLASKNKYIHLQEDHTSKALIKIFVFSFPHGIFSTLHYATHICRQPCHVGKNPSTLDMDHNHVMLQRIIMKQSILV